MAEEEGVVLLIQPLPTRSAARLPSPLSIDEIAWTVTTLEVDLATSDRTHLPQPDT